MDDFKCQKCSVTILKETYESNDGICRKCDPNLPFWDRVEAVGESMELGFRLTLAVVLLFCLQQLLLR